MLKRLLNRAGDVLFSKPFTPIWRRRLRGKAMVYLYHRIEEFGDHPFLDQGGSPVTSAQEFRRDIRTLKELGAKFVRFSDLARCDYKANAFYVVICVDDGFASNYQAGLEIAEAEGIPTTIFQCASMITPDELIWEHQLYYLFYHRDLSRAFRKLCQKNNWPLDCDEIRESVSPFDIEKAVAEFVTLYPETASEMVNTAEQLYPTKAQLREAQDSGHEIASHGDKHYKRSSIGLDTFVAELVNSKRKLNEVLDRPVNAFSYPFNSYQEGDELECAKEYSFIATVDGGVVDQSTRLLSIPRNTYPGPAKTNLRHRRWLLTGSI